MEQSPWEANRFSASLKFPAFYGIRRFITAFTRTHQLPLSWVRSIQSMPLYFTSWRFILILSSHVRLVLPSGLFPSGFHTETLYARLLSPIRATCSAHVIFLDLITRIILGEEYRSMSSWLCSFCDVHGGVSLLLVYGVVRYVNTCLSQRFKSNYVM